MCGDTLLQRPRCSRWRLKRARQTWKPHFSTNNVEGFIGGLQGGCNYSAPSGVVIGVAGDYGWTNADGTHGYAFDRVLPYIESGAAWKRVDYRASTTMIGTAYLASDTRSGWTIVGGGEYGFTNRLSAFVEYGYYGFGTERIRLSPQYSSCPRPLSISKTPPTSSAPASTCASAVTGPPKKS